MIQTTAPHRVASKYLVELVSERGQVFSYLQSMTLSRTVSIAPAILDTDTDTDTDTRMTQYQAIKPKPMVIPT